MLTILNILHCTNITENYNNATIIVIIDNKNNDKQQHFDNNEY